jgi:hypothetical protein
MEPYITTFTGKTVNPLNPTPDDIDIRDIAHSLALVPRFAGHTQKPISIAQHSVYVSRLLPRAYAMHGLLHDASEAYLGDVTRWLKATPEFSALNQTYVDWADKLMVRYEIRESLPGHEFPPLSGYNSEISDHEQSLINEAGPWEPWPWEVAEGIFLLRFDLLAGYLSSRVA